MDLSTIDRRTLSINKKIAGHATSRSVSALEATEEIVPNLSAEETIDELERKIRATWEYEKTDVNKYHLKALEFLKPKVKDAFETRIAEYEKSILASHYSIIESVIALNGTRPTLFTGKNNIVQFDHPMAGDYADDIERNVEQITKICQATGRIQPENWESAESFFGTGVLANNNGAVLTNLHVAEAVLRGTKNWESTRGNRVIRIFSGVCVDFAGWAGSGHQILFPVTEIRFPAPELHYDNGFFKKLDMAVMQLGDPIENAHQLPAPLPFRVDVDAEIGALGSACVVGFPGHPQEGYGTEGIRLEGLIERLFSNKFGLKRFAPGKVNLALGKVYDDPAPWVIGHDSTTLPGHSGSSLANFTGEPEPYAFGLHFAGKRNHPGEDSNYAHALSPDQIQKALRKLGVLES